MYNGEGIRFCVTEYSSRGTKSRYVVKEGLLQEVMVKLTSEGQVRISQRKQTG